MTAEPWNEFNLIQPVITTIGVKNPTIDLTAILKTLDAAILLYEFPKDLEESAAFCSRLLARRKNSFHNLIGFRELRKVNAALCRLLRLNIVTVLQNFRSTLPDFIKSGHFETELPSQELFDYLLLRLMALQKLYLRITECCLNSTKYFAKLLNQNFFFDIITALVSTIAKIWNISRENAIRTAEFYKQLLPHRSSLPLRKKTLCPEFKFPDELQCNFGDSKEEIPKQLAELAEQKHSEVITLSDDEENSDHRFRGTGKVIIRSELPPGRISQPKDIDLGVVISRNAIEQEEVDPKRLKTLESILQFIREEDVKRRNSLSDCLTKNLSAKSWKLLRKKISKLNTNDNRSAVKLFRKTLNIS